MADKSYSNEEPIQKERLSTADLADVGRDASSASHSPDETPVEVVRIPPQTEQTSETLDVPVKTERVSAPASRQNASAGTAVAKAKEPDDGPLFSSEEADRLRTQWDSIQVGFVDEPRKAVEEADNLVAVAIKRLAEQFAEERSRLEGAWDRGGDVSTEDLRLALRRYRSFFGRLLSV